MRWKLASRLSGFLRDTARNGVGMSDLYSVRDSQVQKANDLIQGVKVKRHRRDLFLHLADPTSR